VRDITRFRQADEMKSTFISVISHELKTPVALIKGYVCTLLRDDADWDSKFVKESLTIIEEEADRLNQLIENLLDATRLQAGGVTLKNPTFLWQPSRKGWQPASKLRPTNTSLKWIFHRIFHWSLQMNRVSNRSSTI
jgi:signal transduction histidine kinase